MMTERQVEAAIQEAFRFRHRITLWKIDAGGRGLRSAGPKASRGSTGIPAGFPDLLGLEPVSGRAVFIEVKRPGGKPAPHQAMFLAHLRGMGAVAFWADSVDSALRQFGEQVAA
jgi:hypothetical protein